MSEILEIPARQAGAGRACGSVLTAGGENNAIRWRAGERLHHLFERQCRMDGSLCALEVDGVALSFSELDRLANRMARYLGAQGLGAGDRIGLIVDRSIDAYAALLAVLKIDAAYVPLDVKFPIDRIEFIAEDAEIKAFVTTDAGSSLVKGLGLPVFDLEQMSAASQSMPSEALAITAKRLPGDQLCYIIYTSGSTGRPKGVAVNHSSICNFVVVAAEAYGYRRGDRVYQGMTLAFDFSVEELWVPLLSGATLVPSPADRQMVGAELSEFLATRRITAMCCVPTLLATIADELPDLRLLLVSGEACPHDIVQRWHRPWRRMLNAYGPTEATVTATWTEVAPDREVTIGVPLPTYTVAILETGHDMLVEEEGGVGEIAIGGIGLAEGYVNRDDLTAKAFIPDFLGLANNPSERLYRTGDLGRITEYGEIEYLGRIDAQVKIRGYRIELAEIENVLLEADGVAQAVVTTHELAPGLVELAAYYTCFAAGPKPSRDTLLQTMRRRLPSYMIPAYLEELDVMPLLASHKADRKALPAPKGMRLVSGAADFVAPRNDLERTIAACLAETLKLEAVSVDDHFFDDLGAHSLLMGQFLAAVNQRLPNVRAAISDVYLAPSVALLGEVLAARRDEAVGARRIVEPAHVASDFDYLLCGTLQAAFYVFQFSFYMTLTCAAFWYVGHADGYASMFGRALLAGSVVAAIGMALPIALKWFVIGRWQAEDIPIWSLRYFKFWVVEHAVGMSSWLLFRGTALFNVYLRLLGARIGHGAIILTEKVPTATDLLTIGDYSVLRKHSKVAGWRAENGFIKIGAVDIGARATIGEHAVVDIGTAIGDEGQLGHASALLEGQKIPPFRRYHGSPAVETGTEFRCLPHAGTTRLRRGAFAVARLVSGIVVTAVMVVLLLALGQAHHSTTSAVSLIEALPGLAAWSLILLVGAYSTALAISMIVPRLLRLLLVSGKVYPLYGFHHFAAQMIGQTGFSQPLQTLFGDSSAIVHHLRWIGVRQPGYLQTGSNFGTTTHYDSPLDVEVGPGSMCSDGLSIINLEIGSGSFRMAPVRVSANSFFGNSIVYPAQSRIGDNCLLGTKVMIPVDGKVRSDVGLLGSPCFEIPREVGNGPRFNPVPSNEEERRRLRDKNWFNFRTALLYLGSLWLLLFGFLVIGSIGGSSYDTAGMWAVAAVLAVAPFWLIAHNVIMERLSIPSCSVFGQPRMPARNCTIHERYFWQVERHWKFTESIIKHTFTGTPFRPMLLRMAGLKVGRKVFDGGSAITEKALVEIGDNCCLNAGCTVQGHSLEDGLFKSDRIVIADNCTVGHFGLVHYGVAMASNTVLSPDAFLMKGSTTEPSTYWQGNPARMI